MKFTIILQSSTQFKKEDRLVIKRKNLNFIGTITKSSDFVYIELDNGEEIKLSKNSKLILGYGISRKRNSDIPDNLVKNWIITEEINVTKLETKKDAINYLSLFNINLSKFNEAQVIKYVKKLSKDTLLKIMKMFDHYYYNSSDPLISDSVYDLLFDYIQEFYPSEKYTKKVGSPVATVIKNKVKLPYAMASLNKAGTTNELERWIKKHNCNYIISDKIDGVSLLIEGKKLFSRGDGKIGQDISYLLPYLKIPKTNLVIRAELIMQPSNFTKYSKEFANPRNLVSGLVNKKSVDPSIFKDVDIVAHEVIKPIMTPLDQFKTLKKLGFTTPKTMLVDNLDFDELFDYLKERKSKTKYEMDGLVVTQNIKYKRTSENPEYSVKFKPIGASEIIKAKVINVKWTPSKHGFLKPVVIIEPVKLSGVTINKATGFNAYFIENGHKKGENLPIAPIGKGAIVQLIRSGDVIPHILKVIKGAKNPIFPSDDYSWTDSGIDIFLDDMDNDTVNIKKITNFFRVLGTEFISVGIIKKLYDEGFNSIKKIIKIKKQQLLEIPGIQITLATKIRNEIDSVVSEIDLPKLMFASGIWGRTLGELRFRNICQEFPDILTISSKKMKDCLLSLNGFQEKIANAFIENLDDFKEFLDGLSNVITITKIKKVKKSSNLLDGVKVCFTGFRDKELESLIIKNSGNVVNMSKSTTILLIKDRNFYSTKVQKAEDFGIKIMTKNEFLKKYKIE